MKTNWASNGLSEKGWQTGTASTSLAVIVSLKLRRIPAYAPVPEPATTGAVPATAAMCPPRARAYVESRSAGNVGPAAGIGAAVGATATAALVTIAPGHGRLRIRT